MHCVPASGKNRTPSIFPGWLWIAGAAMHRRRTGHAASVNTQTLTRTETYQLHCRIGKQRRKHIWCKLGFSPASRLYVFPAATLCCTVLLPSDLKDAFVTKGFTTKHTQMCKRERCLRRFNVTIKSLLALAKDLDYIK